ncbi:MAG: Slp family lipoprotein [Nitrospira sp.]|nr:Slp family lipoprotein [Nitrospira sp.]
MNTATARHLLRLAIATGMRRAAARAFGPIALSLALFTIAGCSTAVPSRYLDHAVPHTTLTAIASAPDNYRGRMVILGGTIVGETIRADQLWLHVRNRPLDEDYIPQLPPSPDDPEAAEYWVVVEVTQRFPPSYHRWADMILAGYVAGRTPSKEIIIKLAYARGRNLDLSSYDAWDHPEYATFVPSSIAIEYIWE